MRHVAFTLLFAVAACEPAGRGEPARDADDDAVTPIDSPPPPPPSVDAGPPPSMICDEDAGGMCVLPPSTCLDPNYLLYYTGGTCEDGMCSFTTNLLYCTCVNGGCQGGFT